MGNRPRVGIAVLVLKDNKVLFGKRKGAHGEATWAPPGGHLEYQETLEGCARREVQEETGMRIQNICIGPFTDDIFKKEGKHYITIFILANHANGSPKIMEPHKCEKWDWFEWNNLPKPLFLPVRNLLKQNFNPFKL